MSEAAADPPPQPEVKPEEAPEWANDEYLTSGARFYRWNLISLVLGLAALGAGVLWLQSKG